MHLLCENLLAIPCVLFCIYATIEKKTLKKKESFRVLNMIMETLMTGFGPFQNSLKSGFFQSEKKYPLNFREV